ncbi:uncharacterized protein EI90DRAFT_3114431 [Cantharellus anzutake]|uniref:uncharacterized protein n=1 Tax=Cantharellus anzutake TaxID=1750568 RepID=UPI001907AA6E|nr:uncharacterized protein EI90DRAFT_3114431 [Cantharellus anzutake]KAF8343840.1 hypothetical protein EI90DRAFT_3114431 [Cantharellus anzutake]
MWLSGRVPHSDVGRWLYENSHTVPPTYYTQASSYQWIPGIKIPRLTLHSKDDPMVAPRNLLHKEIENSSHVVMASTHAGGHVAWFTDKESRWFTIPTKEWVLALLDVDPSPKRPVPALPADAKGIVRSQQWPDRIGYKCLDSAEGLVTARIYNQDAQAPAIGS